MEEFARHVTYANKPIQAPNDGACDGLQTCPHLINSTVPHSSDGFHPKEKGTLLCPTGLIYY